MDYFNLYNEMSKIYKAQIPGEIRDYIITDDKYINQILIEINEVRRSCYECEEAQLRYAVRSSFISWKKRGMIKKAE